jgi:hypothetical protein
VFVLLDIICCFAKKLRAIPEASKPVVAIQAEQTPHSAAGMAVVNAKSPVLGVGVRGRLSAKGADASLGFEDGLEFVEGDSKSLDKVLVEKLSPSVFCVPLPATAGAAGSTDGTSVVFLDGLVELPCEFGDRPSEFAIAASLFDRLRFSFVSPVGAEAAAGGAVRPSLCAVFGMSAVEFGNRLLFPASLAGFRHSAFLHQLEHGLAA